MKRGPKFPGSGRLGAMKTQRPAAILKIVRGEGVASQERLRELLAAEGFDVTQATLSRDIRDLGLAKVAAPDGGSHYSPPPEGPGIRPHLGQLLPSMLVSVDGVGPLLVLKTPAGGVLALGLRLDAQGRRGGGGPSPGGRDLVVTARVD